MPNISMNLTRGWLMAQIERTGLLDGELAKAGEEAVQFAVDIAPVSTGKPHEIKPGGPYPEDYFDEPGNYAESIHYIIERSHETGRKMVKVLSKDRKASWIEFGTGKGGYAQTAVFAQTRMYMASKGFKIR